MFAVYLLIRLIMLVDTLGMEVQNSTSLLKKSDHFLNVQPRCCGVVPLDI